MANGGFFSRLKDGLSRSTQKLGGGITAVFTKRRLDEEALDVTATGSRVWLLMFASRSCHRDIDYRNRNGRIQAR